MKRILYILLAALGMAACSENNLPGASFTLFQVDAVKATAGDGAATLTWTPSDQGTPLAYYITWTADKNGVSGGSEEVNGELTSLTVEELVNNVSYTFYVQPRYKGGLAGKVSAVCTPKSTRFDVTDLVASAGSSKVRLTWTKPASDKLTGYKIKISPGNRTLTVQTPATVRQVVDGLTNGSEYTFTVVAVYTNGDSQGVQTVATPGVVSPITVASTTLVQNQTTKFEYNDMYFLNDAVTSVVWNFGDGQTSTEKSPSHAFSTAGTFTVKATVTYANTTTESGTIDITVVGFKWSSIDLLNGTYTGYVKASNPVFSPDGTTVYLPTSNAKGDLFAIDIFTGEIKWVYAIATATYGGGAAVGKDGSIYQGAQDKKLYAIKPNGTEKWTFTSAGNIESFPAITSDDKLYFGANGSANATLYALNAATGVELWNKTLDGTVSSAVAVDAAGNVYVGTSAAVYSFSSDGTQRWKTGTALNVTERGSFALSGTTLYAALKAGAGVAAINMTNGTILWTSGFATGDAYFPVTDAAGAVYFTDKGSKSVVAVNADGSKKWSASASAALIYAGLVLGDNGVLYTGTQAKSGDSYLVLGFNAATGHIDLSVNSSQQMMSAFTLAPDRRLYYGSVAGKLNAYEANASVASSWSVRGGNLQGSNSLK